MSKFSSKVRGREVRGNKFLSLNNVLRTTEKLTIRQSHIRRMPFSERNLFPRYALCTVMLLAALPATAKPKTTPVQTAVIENTGSTNTFGYKITVTSTGPLTYSFTTLSSDATSPAGKPVVVTVRESRYLRPEGMPALGQRAQRFFGDLDAAMPLTALPVRHGMRSASFGTRTTIIYKGQTSPDLTFASDPRTVALKADIDAIIKTLGIGNAPKRPIVVIHADR